MGRFFGTQIILPFDPTLLFHAATMGWVQNNRTILPITSIPWAATITPNAASGASYFRVGAAQGATTINPPTSGADTQEVWLELPGQATNATAVTLSTSTGPAWELGTNVTTRSFTIQTGSLVAYLRAINRGGPTGVWRVLGIDTGS